MSACHETNHEVFSRNTCRKIGLNAFEKKRPCPFFKFSPATARRKKPKKIVKLRLG